MADADAKKPRGLDFPADVIDTHIHLRRHYAGGLPNEWHPAEAESFRRDFTEQDYLASIAKGSLKVKSAVFVECFNRPPVEEAKWVLKMIDDPNSVVVAMTAQIYVQKGASAVTEFLDQLRGSDGTLPKGLKGARMVFPAAENKAADCCIEQKFLEGLAELGKHGLHWEFCVFPFMAPHIPECIAKFPEMTFIINHLAHNGNDGGEMEKWGPAIDAIGKFPNTYCKMGASEEWGVSDKGAYMDRAIAAFGFDRILYESNWFVNEAMGDSYDTTARLLLEACVRAGATEGDLEKAFRGNAIKAYRLDI
jgi:L-fuconolactonase